MRVPAMALSGAAMQPGQGLRPCRPECLFAARGPDGKSIALIGRALGVCVALGAGLASFVANGLHVDGYKAIEAASPVFALAPLRPQLKLASVSPGEPGGPAGQAANLTSRIDRVPYDLLLPGGYGDPDELIEFGPRKIRRHLVETILKAARATDIDPALLMAIADKESSFSTTVRAKTSSATGLFQFIEATWLKVVRQFGAKHGLEKEAAAITFVDGEHAIEDPAERARILDLRRDPYISALLAGEMLNRDRNRIAGRIGRDLTEGETYLAHFLGPDDAERFMTKVVGEPHSVAAKLLPRPARANRPIFFARGGRKARSLSVAQVHDRFEEMMETRLDRYRKVHDVAGPLAYADASTP